MSDKDYSSQTANFEVRGDKYEISLLSVKAATILQLQLLNQAKIKSEDWVLNIDPEFVWNTAEKLLKFAEVNNVPLDMEVHFRGKQSTLYLVLLECVKANCPDFLEMIPASALAKMRESFASASGQSAPKTSKQATTKQAQQ